MLDGAMLVWFALTAASVAFVVGDSLLNGVTSWVQRIAWILVTLYTGPVGLFFYLLGCRRPFPDGHDRYTRATWKQSLNSEMHCLAGDATGIIVAAAIVPALGLGNGWDMTIEYLAAFVTGLLIFQALMMIGMYDGKYFRAVRRTVFAETVSMNFVMVGMIPVMVILETNWAGSESPLEPAFWFRMSVAAIAGGLTGYPVNRWLVANHLKHGCMTLPGADGPAPALGHRSPERMGAMDMDGKQQAVDDGPMPMGDEPMVMNRLSPGRALIWVAVSFGALGAAVWLTSLVVPIRFAPGG